MPFIRQLASVKICKTYDIITSVADHKYYLYQKLYRYDMTYIRYSKHARKRMIERGISGTEVMNAILKGSKRIQDRKIISAYTYFEVVYKMIKDEAYVITVKQRW